MNNLNRLEVKIPYYSWNNRGPDKVQLCLKTS